ncbi:lipopolysaccharide biosynthesis protein [Aerococcus viridans]
MNEKNLNKQILNAAKWSSITEIVVKLISPIINMILARVIAPEEFGVVATATMIVSFADMFSDAGFQKYLVQHDFTDEKERNDNANVAFWTNLTISLTICSIIFIFREPLASMVGNSGLGDVVFIASLQLILTAFSSIQMALYRREFDFKTLFISRVISALIPVMVTLPLAYLGFSYWAIIIGNLTRQFSDAAILTYKSKWKPKLYYNIQILKEMFSFSIWTLIEAFSIWLTTWADSFIIGRYLNPYYLGLYKNSTSMVNALFTIITGATTPVLFSSLSRLQEDNNRFNQVFLRFQKLVSIIVFPMGIGVFLFSDLATKLLLGNQWMEASNVIGIWALTSSLMIVLGNYCSELYRAKGKPKLSFMAQVLHLIFLIPACIISARYGFWALVYTRSLMRLQFILVHFVIMKVIVKFPINSIFKNIFPAGVSAIGMFIIGYFVKQVGQGIMWNFVSIIICAIIYIILILLFPSVRLEVRSFIRNRTV